MSVLIKGFQIFSLAGTVASVPFIPSLTEKNTTIPVAELTAGGGEEKVLKPDPEPAPIPAPKPLPQPTPPRQEVNQGQQVMQQAMEEMATDRGKGAKGTNGLGCFWIPGFPAELFFCFDKGDLGSAPYLFHYSWRERGVEKLQKVESIGSGVKAILKKGTTRPMKGRTKILMNWIGRWQESSPFNPGKHCRVTQEENENYKLTCSNSSSSDAYTWKKDISKWDIVEPNNSEIKRVSEK